MTTDANRPVSAATLERIRRFRLIDDVFMRVCFQDNIECTQLVLRIILDKPDLRVQSVTAQKELAGLRGRSIRLDIAATDSEGRLYDIEIQRKDEGARPRRARGHQSLMDAATLGKNEDFERLPECFVILITENDVLKGGLPLYHIDRRVAETGLPFGDGSHIIYVNGAMRDGDTDLARLMHDFFCAEPKDMYYELLAEVTGHHKTDNEEIRKMGSVIEEILEEGRIEGREEGRIEGREEGREEGMIAARLRALEIMLQENRFSCEEMARYTSLPLDEVRRLAEERRNGSQSPEHP